jgi:hypothetical protein
MTKQPHHAARRDAFSDTNAANTPAKLGDAPAIENTGMNAASMGNTIATARKNMLHLMQNPASLGLARLSIERPNAWREIALLGASWNCLGVNF